MREQMRKFLVNFSPNDRIAIGVLGVALVVRLVGLGAESAWIDEGYSLSLAKYSFADIIRGTVSDQHPPLYYLLLHVWLAFGTNITMARLLSVFLGVINVYQLQILGRKFGGQWLGLVASLLLAINPMHVWYSQEVRQYMLLAVLTTAAMSELWACLAGKNRWIFYGLFALLSLYTQYFAVFILFSQAVLVLIWSLWKQTKHILVQWLLTSLVVAVLFLPWLPVAINQFLYHPTPWIDDPVIAEIRDVPLRLLLGSGVVILPDWVLWLATIGLLIMLIWMFQKGFRGVRGKPHPMVFLGAWCFLPYLSISLISIFYPVFQFKQFLIVLAPALLLAGLFVSYLPKHLKILGFVMLLLIPSVTLIYQQGTLSKDDWRGMSAYIEKSWQQEDIIYTNPAAASLVLNLYLDPSYPMRGYPPDYDILSGGWQGELLTADSAIEQLQPIADQSDRVWLVEFFPEFWDKAGYLPGWLSSQGILLEQHWFGNIHLRLFGFGSDSP